MLHEAYQYKYEDTPRYGVLIFMLENELLKIACIPDNYFHFLQQIPNYYGRNLVHIEGEEEHSDSIPDEQISIANLH